MIIVTSTIVNFIYFYKWNTAPNNNINNNAYSENN